jgi:hypothetical protein
MRLLRLSAYRERHYLPPRPSLQSLRRLIDRGEIPGLRNSLGYWVDLDQHQAPPPPPHNPLDDIADPLVRRAVGLA